MSNTSTDTSASTNVNLPVPILPTFNCDQLSLIFGSCLVDPVFVVDRESGFLVSGNHRLLEFLDRNLADLEDRELEFASFVHIDDRGIFQTWLREDFLGREMTLETRFLVDNSPVPVEVSARSIRWQGKEFVLGFVRDCADRIGRENDLREQLELQKGRAMQALKSSLRVYELNEKIKSTLVLTTTLLNVENEEQLYDESVRILTNTEGLNFRDVSILYVDGSDLVVGSSTD
ncbi:MAG: PAS domain-containing protein, partial [Planctomycetota bacterium]